MNFEPSIGKEAPGITFWRRGNSSESLRTRVSQTKRRVGDYSRQKEQCELIHGGRKLYGIKGMLAFQHG